MNRRSKASSVIEIAALVALASACGGTQVVPEIESSRRRPDGVAIDPTSAPPTPRDRAEVREGLVTLRTPIGADRALDIVDDFFRRVVRKDNAFDAIFTRDAIATGGGTQNGPEGSRNLSSWWTMRYQKLDYTKLAGEPIYQASEAQLFRADDAPDSLPSQQIKLDGLNEGDVVVYLPVVTAHAGADRYFGDEMIFWLRRDGDRFKIYRVQEEFTLP